MFKRNREQVFKSIKVKEDNTFVTSSLKIYFPTLYVDKKLAVIDNTCKILGIFIIADKDNNTTLSTIPTMVEVTPTTIEIVDIDDIPHYQLSLEKGDLLFNNMKVVQLLDMAYNIFNLMMINGKVPWFIGYTDLLKIFENFNKYTGSNVSSFIDIIKIFIRISGRDKNNLSVYYSNILNTEKDLATKEIEWIGLSNIYFTFKSTMSKIGGSYFKKALLSAIVTPEKEPTQLENILRK